MATSPFAQFSLIVPDSDTGDAGHIRRNAFDATAQNAFKASLAASVASAAAEHWHLCGRPQQPP
mgnify:CR=1 FL=1